MDIVQVYSDHGRSGLNIAGREGLNGLLHCMDHSVPRVKVSLRIISALEFHRITIGCPVVPLSHLPQTSFFCVDHLSRGELQTGVMLSACHELKLSGGGPCLEAGTNLAYVVSLIPRRRASLKMARSSVTTSCSMLRSRTRVMSSRATPSVVLSSLIRTRRRAF